MLNLNLNILGASNKPIVPIQPAPEPTTTTTTTSTTTTSTTTTSTTTTTTTIGGGIVTDQIVLWLDAALTASYPGTDPEVTDTWYDLSGNDNDAVWRDIQGAYTASNGAYFNLTTGSQYATIQPDTSLNVFDGDYTIDMWYSIDALGSASQYQDICGLFVKPLPNIAGTANPGIAVSVNRASENLAPNTTKFSLTQNTSGSLSDLGGGFVTVGQFVNLQIVRSGTTTTAYTNLTASLSTTNSPVINMNDTGGDIVLARLEQAVGRPSAGYELAPGKMGFVAVYNKALSEAEREQNHNYIGQRY